MDDFEVISPGVIELAIDVQFGAKTLKIQICGHPTCVLVQIRSLRSYSGVPRAYVARQRGYGPLLVTRTAHCDVRVYFFAEAPLALYLIKQKPLNNTCGSHLSAQVVGEMRIKRASGDSNSRPRIHACTSQPLHQLHIHAYKKIYLVLYWTQFFF